MKSLKLSICGMLMSSIPLLASAELVPLWSMNLSQTQEEYILSRCAAFYINLATALGDDGRYLDAEQIATSKASAVFEELVIRYANLQKDRQEARSDVAQFVDAYISDFNGYYIESGQRFDNELFQSDSSICEQLVASR